MSEVGSGSGEVVKWESVEKVKWENGEMVMWKSRKGGNFVGRLVESGGSEKV